MEVYHYKRTDVMIGCVYKDERTYGTLGLGNGNYKYISLLTKYYST